VKLLRNRTGAPILILWAATMIGCNHQPQVPPLSAQAQTPDIFLQPPPETTLRPMETEPPPLLTDAKPAVAEEVKPKKRPKRPVTASPPTSTPAQTPAATVAASDAPPTEATTLGALDTGGTANPKQQQEVAGKIAAVDKRVNDLPSATVDREQKQIAKVRLFLKEALDALKGGDVEGAGILATKADLLLDDLTK